MNKNLLYLSLFILLMIVNGCVSQKKHQDLQILKDHYKAQVDSLKKDEDAIQFTEYDYRELEREVENSQAELVDLQESFNYLKEYNQDILGKYDELLAQNKELLTSSSSDAQQLAAQLSERNRKLEELDREIARLKNENRQLRDQAETAPIDPTPPPTNTVVTNDCSNYERQVAELNNILREKDNKLNLLRSNVNKALLGFSSSDLSVSESQGKVYVSLSQNLLFSSNSDKIDWKGKKALRSLADVLNANPDIDIEVEGHTDSDGSAARNWDLSVRRATSVVKVLTSYKVDPKRITASGRSFYFPIAPNTTSAGKAKNRRTEIILSPKLDELY
ncbi:MAG: OmpA family protein, partial [Bacteroidota bacterium]